MLGELDPFCLGDHFQNRAFLLALFMVKKQSYGSFLRSSGLLCTFDRKPLDAFLNSVQTCKGCHCWGRNNKSVWSADRAVDGWRDDLMNLGRPSSLGCSFCFYSQITSSTYKNDDSKTVNAFPQLLQLLRECSCTSQARHFAWQREQRPLGNPWQWCWWRKPDRQICCLQRKLLFRGWLICSSSLALFSQVVHSLCFWESSAFSSV